jgi:hypothetical protein
LGCDEGAGVGAWLGEGLLAKLVDIASRDGDNGVDDRERNIVEMNLDDRVAPCKILDCARQYGVGMELRGFDAESIAYILVALTCIVGENAS